MSDPHRPATSPGAASLDWTTMSALAPDARVDLWQRAYEGYYVPAHFDRATVELMGRIGDLDDAHSPVLMADGVPVGFGALGLRGPRAWLGGFGVALAQRRRGLGRRLMDTWLDAARARGARHAQLEVLEPNVPARALYEAYGFRAVRWLEVWSLAAAPSGAATGGIRRVSALEAQAIVDLLPGSDEPWQRDPAVVRVLADDSLGLVAGEPASPAGAAVVRAVPGRVSVLRLRTAETPRRGDTIAALFAAAMALAEGATLRWLNVPEGDPGSAVLRACEGKLEIRQVEMARAL